MINSPDRWGNEDPGRFFLRARRITNAFTGSLETGSDRARLDTLPWESRALRPGEGLYELPHQTARLPLSQAGGPNGQRLNR